jgi:putative membrane protein
MKRMLLCAAAAALMSACSSMPTGEAAMVAEAAMDQPAPAAMEFVRMAGASDLYEIQSSQLVMQTTQNDEVRDFAQMMIDHHTMTTQTVMRAAQAAGMTPPPPALDQRKSDMIRQLQAAQGMARDNLYIQQQVMAHQEALTLHTSYSRNGDTAELKTAAGTAVPIVARHYNQIMAMQNGGGSSGGHSGH